MTLTINTTECISFPRSGHHLLHRILAAYFGDALVYCRRYGNPEDSIGLNDDTNYQKNHDLDLDTPIENDRQYVVQIRYPIDSIVSWYKWACEHQDAGDSPGDWMNFALTKSSFWMRFFRKWVLNYVPNRRIVNYADLIAEPTRTVCGVVQIRYPIDSIVSWYKWSCEHQDAGDSPGDWMNFALTKSSFWMRFFRKWVLNYVPNRLIVNYADLVAEPTRTVSGVVQFLTETEPDEDRIESICQEQNISRKNHYSGFKYYGAGFFDLFKGLFAAVPGVDIDNDELVIVNGEDDPIFGEVSRITQALSTAGADILSLTGRLTELSAAMQTARQ